MQKNRTRRKLLFILFIYIKYHKFDIVTSLLDSDSDSASGRGSFNMEIYLEIDLE